MKLRTVSVRNYRCLKKVDIDIADLTVLLGPNSAGKSSLLQALEFFFDGVELEAADVFAGQDATIMVECTFDDLTPRDREVFGPYAAGSQMVLRRSWKPGEDQKLTGRGRQFPAFEEIRQKSGRERTAAYRALRDDQPDLGLAAATNIAAVDQAMLTFEQDNPDRCDVVDDQDASRLFGFGTVGKSKVAERFPFVLVPAIRDAATEAVERRGSLLARLLTAVTEQRAAADEQLKAIESEARAKYEEAVMTSHGPVLLELGERLTAQVRRYVPSAEIKLLPTAAGFSIDAPRVDVRGGEEQELTDLGRQGHGFRRAFVISVLEYLAEATEADEGESTEKPTLFLAIEEPELYQHPPRARHFYDTLAKIAEESSVQVCYATHSPFFVSADRFDSLRIFRRERGNTGTSGATVTAASLDSVKDKLPASASGDPRAYLERTLSEQFREAFFAKAVFLLEGPSDAAVFNTAGSLLGRSSLAADGIVTTNVGGKGSQPIGLAILDALKIPSYCIFDGDAGATDGVKCDTCGRAKSDRSAAAASNRRVLKALGADEVDFPGTTVEATWACFHEEVEDAIPGLRERAAEVANEMGWRGKSPEAYAEAVFRLGADALPEEIATILDRVRALA